MAQRKQIPLGTMIFQVQSLASLSGLRSGVAVSCGVDRRHSSDPVSLWLWHRSAAVAPIRSLAWKSPYAAGAALKRKNKKQTKKKPESNLDYRKLCGASNTLCILFLINRFEVGERRNILL